LKKKNNKKNAEGLIQNLHRN